MKACRTALTLLILTPACAAPPPPAFPQGELVDLSHAYDAQTIYFAPELVRARCARVRKSHRAGSSAGDGRVRDRAADEGWWRERRAAARGGHPSAAIVDVS